MNRLNRIGTVVTLAAVSAIAMSQDAVVKVASSEAEAAKAIEARQAIFKEIKDLNAPISEMLRRQRPVDPAVVATNSAKIQALIEKVPAAFLIDTRQFKGTKTAALDGIWNSMADFKTKNDAMVTALAAAVAAGKSGNAAETQKAMAGLGRGCGGCHDAYKIKL